MIMGLKNVFQMLRTTKRAIDGLTLAYYINKIAPDKHHPKVKNGNVLQNIF
jgi:hypothetical protein